MVGEPRERSCLSLIEWRLVLEVGPNWQNHPMRKVCSGGTQQFFLLVLHLRPLNMAADIARVQKKWAEGFWGFLPAFCPVEGLSDNSVTLKSQRKRQSLRSCSNPGTSHKILSMILDWKSSIYLYIIVQSFCTERGKSPLSSHWEPKIYIWYIFGTADTFKCPKCQLLLLMWEKKSSVAAKWSLWISPQFREGEAWEKGCQTPAPHCWRGDRLGKP